MPIEAEILGNYVVITSFIGVRIEDIRILVAQVQERIRNVKVQCFDADFVAGWEHLYFAALNALRAFETATSISKDLAVETLLYASGQHQIRKAIELFGLRPSSSSVAVLVIAGTRAEACEGLRAVSDLLGGEMSDEGLDMNSEKIETVTKLFNISDLEANAASRNETAERTLTNLVIEHMALLTKQAGKLPTRSQPQGV